MKTGYEHGVLQTEDLQRRKRERYRMKMICVSVCGVCPWVARNVYLKSIERNVTICGAIAKYREVDLNSIPSWCPLEDVPNRQEVHEVATRIDRLTKYIDKFISRIALSR